MNEKPKARLTIEQHQKAINEAIWIDASPHEWPTLEKVPLLCNALLDSVVMVDYLVKRLAAVEAERDAARAGEARAVEALEKILVGGNHLASALTGMFEDRLPPYGTDFNEACRAFAESDEYDLWVCWAVIMRVRDSLSDPQPALDWLAQQRREAVAAWIEKEATKCRQQNGEYYERSVEGMLEEASALRAGEVPND